MSTPWRFITRLELAFELALTGVSLILFRAIRPVIDVSCGTALTSASDDTIELLVRYHLPLVVPVAVALVELNFAIRPGVKRAVRIAVGAGGVLILASYALAAAAVIPR